MKRSIIKFISTFFPNLVVGFAYDQLTNPQVKKLRNDELRVLDKAEKEILKHREFDIQLYTWKGGDNKVLLIHGWEGQAGNFADIIEELINHNFTIYAFDAPSHGFSSKGRASLFEFTELVGLLIKKYAVRKLVSHSFGGVATTFSLYTNQDIVIDKYLLLTVPDKFIERIDDVVEQIGITEKVKHLLIERLERETKLDVYKLCVSDFVKEINVEKALIIHDTYDKIIPIYRAKNVLKNWKNSHFLEISGTGHFRILRTSSVIEKAITFLQD